MTEELRPEDPELLTLLHNKESGYNYRERRQGDWLINYTLYRDIVEVNRLTQRQSVHIPLMKQLIRTSLKDVDDMPVLYFENLDNDKQKEVFLNEYWKWTVEQNNMELQDIVDKKQVFLNGRTFDQWQIVDGKVKQTVQDTQDILVSRFTDPTNLHSSRFLIHTHIYKTLSELENNPDHDKDKIAELRKFHETEQGIVKVATNAKMAAEKKKKMEALGMPDVDSPTLGDTIVELSLHFVYRQEEGDDEEQLYLYVEADDQVYLMKKRLEERIGTTKDHFWRTHFPYESWADDLERVDFWSDGIADIIRTPNIILDSWFSQLVENRTLRNFGMHYYDSTMEGFEPSTYNPIPWGWYGIPGDPNKVLKKVDIPELSESLDEMQFVISLAEKATGATPTQQGVQTERQITLGEVQLALGEAKERVKGMSKFYTPAWKRRGTMFLKLIEAGSDKLDPVDIYKEGRNTKDKFHRQIRPSDWISKSGYRTKVWSQDEKDAHDSETLQKLNATITLIPGNPKLMEIYQRKLLEFAGLSPEEINDVMELEQRKTELMGGMVNQAQPVQTTQPAQPVTNQPNL